MFKELLKHPGALFFAILVHLALIAILVVSIQWNSKPAALQGKDEIIQAMVVDESKLQAEKQRKLDEMAAKRQAEEQRRQTELDRQRAEKQRQQEAQEVVQEKQRQEAEQQRQAKIKANKEIQVRQQIEKQKHAAQEAKRKEEQRSQAEDAKRKAEAQRKSDAARRQREDLEMMKQQLAQEEADRQAQVRAEQQYRELATKTSQYSLQLQNIVNRNWIRPPTSRTGLFCYVHVRMIPGGEVVDAHVTKGSGDAAFDRSAEMAVLRSSPLPEAPDPSLREFDLLFKPEG